MNYEISPNTSLEDLTAHRQEKLDQLVVNEIPRQREVLERDLAHIAFELGQRE